MTRMANEYERADHDRDERKHDTVLHRLDRPLSTAMDVAILVRALDKIEDAAALIDQFVDTKATEKMLDAVAAGANS